MHGGISYLDNFDIYYYHCHTTGKEFEDIKERWYKITCLLTLPNLPIHKNIYFVPQPKLDNFLKNNQENLVDIEPISIKQVKSILKNK